jgi:Mlc titration factor MtfA (ptsG expression regulator)
MVTVLQIFFTLLLIILIILFVFRSRRIEVFALPDNYQDLLNDYVKFYSQLDNEGKKQFEARFEKFLSAIKITGANAEVEDIDRVLIGAAAVIPVFFISDWEYVNLREVLLYPGNFNTDFDQEGNDRMISGMVGSGSMQNVLIISKWDLRQGFINSKSNRNTAIHEFVHLIDKMDGTLDGIPEILLQRKYVAQWQQLIENTMDEIRQGRSDIDLYAATSPVECFAVISEYFFEQPLLFGSNHPELHLMLQRIFVRIITVKRYNHKKYKH